MVQLMVDWPEHLPYNKWVETRTLWPQECCISGKRIPMYSRAYVRIDQIAKTEIWALAEEFTMARLKGEI